jgi:hypothetical protein
LTRALSAKVLGDKAWQCRKPGLGLGSLQFTITINFRISSVKRLKTAQDASQEEARTPRREEYLPKPLKSTRVRMSKGCPQLDLDDSPSKVRWFLASLVSSLPLTIHSSMPPISGSFHKQFRIDVLSSKVPGQKNLAQSGSQANLLGDSSSRETIHCVTGGIKSRRTVTSLHLTQLCW